VLAGPPGWADHWAAYLRDAGAQVHRIGRLGEPVVLPVPASSAVPGRPVWVVQATEAPPSLAALQHAAPDAGWVVIHEGQDRVDVPYAAQDPVLLLDANVLKRRTLLRAVAAAAGRVPAGDDDTALPARASASAPGLPTREEALRQGRLILVAEDNETNQEVIRRQLALLGFAADVVANGSLALQRWRSGDYALLLTDLHMPELDGYELTQAIRRDERGGTRRPVIALSANAMKDEALRCEAAGMDGYLAKPAQLAQLKATLARWLPTGDTAHAPPAPPTLDLATLEQLVGRDPAVTWPILREFLHTGQEVAHAMSQAGLDGDTARAAAQAHKLGSSAGAVGALDLATLCRAIEAAALAGRVQTLETLLPLFQAKWREVEAAVAQRAAAMPAAPSVQAANRSGAAAPSDPPA
jgi:two-component system, sensor histidine kinase and response regulator